MNETLNLMKHILLWVTCFLFSSIELTYAHDEVSFKSQDAKIDGSKDHWLMKRYPGAVIFDYTRKTQDEYKVLVSGIMLNDSASPDENRYRAKLADTITGDITRIVYDYPESSSPSELLAVVKQRLQALGFDETFSCSKEACGAANGWKMFLYRELGDNDAKQHYLTARRKNTTVAFYVSDLTGQPRGVFDVIVTSKIETTTTQSIIGNARKIDIYFNVGAFDVDPDKMFQAKKFIEQALEEKQTILIKGYADASGDRYENKVLSIKRAQAVKEYLLKHFGVPDNKTETKGVGELESSLGHASLAEKAKDRRVELLIKG